MGAWLLDYRPLEGDHLAPILQAISVTISAVCIAHYLAGERVLGRRARVSTMILLGFTVFAAAIGFARDQALSTIAATAVPILLLVGGLVLTYDAFVNAKSTEQARSIVLTLAVTSLVLKPFLHFYTTDNFSLENVRFQIVSGSVVLVLAHCLISFFTRTRPVDLLIFSLVIAIVAASVTRGYILVGVAMLVFNFGLSWSGLNTKRILRFGFAVGASVLLIGVAAEDSCQVVVSRWQERMTPSDAVDFDLTTASRLAEVAFQTDSITSSWDRALFGNGMAAPTFGSGEYAELFYSVFPDEDRFSVGFGHNSVVSILFVGGVVAGSIVLALALYWIWLASMFTRRWLRTTANIDSFVGCWASSSVVGALALTFSGGIFTQRAESLHLGVSLGMLTWAYDRLTAARAIA